MYRHAIIHPSGEVVNVIIWDPKDKWAPPSGHMVVQDDYVDKGDWYDFSAKKFSKFHSLQQ